MNISHSKAHQIIHSASYQALESSELTELEGHLESCGKCAEYAEGLPQLERLLTRSLQMRWLRLYPTGEIDHRILVDIEMQTRRKQRLNKLTNSLRVLAWAVVILALVVITSWVIGRVRSQDVASLNPPIATVTPTPDELNLPIVGVNPISTQPSTDNGETEQYQKVVTELKPTSTTTRFVGLERVLAKMDLNCDGVEERISGISGPIIPYFDTDQWQVIKLETLSDQGPELVWEHTADDAGVGYLSYELFTLDDCHKFLVLIGHKGWDRIKVFSWDGQQMKVILDRPGIFFPSDTLSPDDFEIEVVPPKTFITYEYTSTLTDSKVIWTLWGFEWDGDRLIQTIEKRKRYHGGG